MAIAEAKPEPDALSLAEAEPEPYGFADPFPNARRSRSGRSDDIYLFRILF